MLPLDLRPHLVRFALFAFLALLALAFPPTSASEGPASNCRTSYWLNRQAAPYQVPSPCGSDDGWASKERWAGQHQEYDSDHRLCINLQRAFSDIAQPFVVLT